MLINVFGYWINPDKICDLQDRAHTCYINYGDSGTEIRNKTSEEVAREILIQTIKISIDASQLSSKPIKKIK